LASTLFMLTLTLVTRRATLPSARALPLMVATGILDTGGNALFVLATQAGRLDMAAVLSSLYPASTVILARLVLGERVTRLQAVGIVAVLVAVVLIAL
jgi:drug/metabolite transporter (DMT)-like permease